MLIFYDHIQWLLLFLRIFLVELTSSRAQRNIGLSSVTNLIQIVMLAITQIWLLYMFIWWYFTFIVLLADDVRNTTQSLIVWIEGAIDFLVALLEAGIVAHVSTHGYVIWLHIIIYMMNQALLLIKVDWETTAQPIFIFFSFIFFLIDLFMLTILVQEIDVHMFFEFFFDSGLFLFLLLFEIELFLLLFKLNLL